MTVFIVSVFLSAFLIFQIQPMIGKVILPWFGGTPAVWSTTILFFQVALTGGYAYAYWLMKKSKQGQIHLLLVGLTLFVFLLLSFIWPTPITPSDEMHNAVTNIPVIRILLLLTISVGLPYFVLASNGPLMQAWFSRMFPGRPYARLYALSNLGSLLGLLTYPILIEPALTVHQQAWVWVVGFLVFSIIACALSYRFRETSNKGIHTPATSSAHANRLLWIILSGIPSLFLLAITNQISQEVAAIPFLWVIPLTIYLLSFIFAFSNSNLYNRKVYVLLFSSSSLVMLWMLRNADSVAIPFQIIAYNLLLFLACIICHSELYHSRPGAEQLTDFYLMVSVGGAIGGLFVNLVAPIVFKGYWEFYLAWLLTIILLVIMLFPRLAQRPVVQTRIMSISFLLGAFLLSLGLNNYHQALFVERNFYGVVRVIELEPQKTIAMIHGVTIHGVQYVDDRALPTTYYAKDSGVGLLLLNHPRKGKGMNVGVLGLGAGVLATYGESGDDYRFYEINPAVIKLAEGQGGFFTFLSQSKAHITVQEGDARISLEQEANSGHLAPFDVLVLDTFSSDSIPTHLITKEAFEIYLKRLATDGVIAVHISNRYLDLRPVLWQISQNYGLSIVQVNQPANPQYSVFYSEWILLSRDKAILEIPQIKSHSVSFDDFSTNVRLWTDDYSNLFQILK